MARVHGGRRTMSCVENMITAQAATLYWAQQLRIPTTANSLGCYSAAHANLAITCALGITAPMHVVTSSRPLHLAGTAC
eukprot:4623487-Amphidinium_carterae.1